MLLESMLFSQAQVISQLIRSPQADQIRQMLFHQEGKENFFRTLPKSCQRDPWLEESLLNEFFPHDEKKGVGKFEVVVEGKYRSKDEALVLFHEAERFSTSLSHISSANDFQEFLKRNYEAYRSLVDTQSESFEPQQLYPEEIFTESVNDTCCYKRQKLTSEFEGARDQEVATGFRKKTRIFLK